MGEIDGMLLDFRTASTAAYAVLCALARADLRACTEVIMLEGAGSSEWSGIGSSQLSSVSARAKLCATNSRRQAHVKKETREAIPPMQLEESVSITY